MTPGTLHALFERLFGGTDDAPQGGGDARLSAHLAARLGDQPEAQQAELSDSPERSTALLAAYLDGGLTEAAQQDMHARLSHSPAAFHDAASADAFLEAIAAGRQTAPADLLASTLARGRPAATPMTVSRRTFPIWKWSGAVAALAAASVAVLVVVSRQTAPTDSVTPITAAAAPGPASTPPSSQAPAEPHGAPAIAGRGPSPSHPPMLPAGAATTVPAPEDCKTATPDKGGKPAKPCGKKASAPTMAPESFDTLPGVPPSSR